MFCPQCQAEYREGFTVCADCEVPLVARVGLSESDLPSEEDEAEGFEQKNAEDPFCIFWEGSDARIYADLCSVLEEATIPYRTLRQEARVFRVRSHSQIKLGVPFSLYEKAEQTVVEAFGSEEEAQRLLRPNQESRAAWDALARQSIKVKVREYQGRSLLRSSSENPADELDDVENISPIARPLEPSEEYGSDLTREVWRGSVPELGGFLQSCFRENNIACNVRAHGAETCVLVSEHDEMRAKEIVREVLEGTPPAE